MHGESYVCACVLCACADNVESKSNTRTQTLRTALAKAPVVRIHITRCAFHEPSDVALVDAEQQPGAAGA